jgi:hypothetical protein
LLDTRCHALRGITCRMGNERADQLPHADAAWLEFTE